MPSLWRMLAATPQGAATSLDLREMWAATRSFTLANDQGCRLTGCDAEHGYTVKIPPVNTWGFFRLIFPFQRWSIASGHGMIICEVAPSIAAPERLAVASVSAAFRLQTCDLYDFAKGTSGAFDRPSDEARDDEGIRILKGYLAVRLCDALASANVSIIREDSAINRQQRRALAARHNRPLANYILVVRSETTIERAADDAAKGETRRIPFPKRRHLCREYLRNSGGEIQIVRQHLRGGKPGRGPGYLLSEEIVQS